MIEIKKAFTNIDFQTIENMAYKVFHKTYANYVPTEHIDALLNATQTEKAIENQINEKNYTYYLFNYKKQNVGYFAVQKQQQKTFLSKFYILEDFRGKKIGKQGLNYILELALKNNSESIELFVNKKNTNAINIYLKNGFKISESVVNSFPNGHLVNDYKMTKKVITNSKKVTLL